MAAPPVEPAFGMMDMSFGGNCRESVSSESEHPHNRLQQNKMDKINIEFFILFRFLRFIDCYHPSIYDRTFLTVGRTIPYLEYIRYRVADKHLGRPAAI